MNLSFNLWQKRKMLTIDQVSALAVGGVPEDDKFLEANKAEILAIKGKLIEDIRVDLKEARFTHGVGYRDDPFIEEDCLNAGITFFSCHKEDLLASCEQDLLFYSAVQSIEINVDEIKAWLTNIEIKPGFFFPDEAYERLSTKEQSTHQTKLMNILDQTVQRYYGETFDPEVKDSYPKQDHIVEWLKQEHSLSNRQAMSIDIIVRPDR